VVPPAALVKTVGLDPGTCGTSDVITVTAPTQVTYCYTINNTGVLTYTRHTLVDNRLGTILSDFPYSLGPGASAFLTQTATITTTTINTATWTVFNPGPTQAYNTVDQARVAFVRRVYLPAIHR
jgi:hypothetical protein